MTRDEKIELIESTVRAFEKIAKQIDKSSKLCFSIETKLGKAIEKCIDQMIKATSMAIGDSVADDKQTMLEWFIYDCQCGLHPRVVTIDGVDHFVACAEDIVTILELLEME